MSLGRYLDILSTSQIFFCRIDRLIDRYEGYVNQHTIKLIDQEFGEFENAEEMRTRLKWLLGETKKNAFISCWHMNYRESDRMWKEYCANGEGIAIKSKLSNLLSGIAPSEKGPMHIRPIKYADKVEEEMDLSNFLELLNYKQASYKFENELRVLLFYLDGAEDPDDENSILIKAPEYGHKVQVHLDTLIDEIYVAPNASDWFYDLIADLTHKTGINKPVLRSSLTSL